VPVGNRWSPLVSTRVWSVCGLRAVGVAVDSRGRALVVVPC
jgi:hypothetical protein